MYIKIKAPLVSWSAMTHATIQFYNNSKKQKQNAGTYVLQFEFHLCQDITRAQSVNLAKFALKLPVEFRRDLRDMPAALANKANLLLADLPAGARIGWAGDIIGTLTLTGNEPDIILHDVVGSLALTDGKARKASASENAPEWTFYYDPTGQYQSHKAAVQARHQGKAMGLPPDVVEVLGSLLTRVSTLEAAMMERDQGGGHGDQLNAVLFDDLRQKDKRIGELERRLASRLDEVSDERVLSDLKERMTKMEARIACLSRLQDIQSSFDEHTVAREETNNAYPEQAETRPLTPLDMLNQRLARMSEAMSDQHSLMPSTEEPKRSSGKPLPSAHELAQARRELEGEALRSGWRWRS